MSATLAICVLIYTIQTAYFAFHDYHNPPPESMFCTHRPPAWFWGPGRTFWLFLDAGADAAEPYTTGGIGYIAAGWHWAAPIVTTTTAWLWSKVTYPASVVNEVYSACEVLSRNPITLALRPAFAAEAATTLAVPCWAVTAGFVGACIGGPTGAIFGGVIACVCTQSMAPMALLVKAMTTTSMGFG